MFDQNANSPVVKSILLQFAKLENNVDELTRVFSPMSMKGRSELELKNFNDTLININQALASVRRFVDSGNNFMGMGMGNFGLFPY